MTRFGQNWFKKTLFLTREHGFFEKAKKDDKKLFFNKKIKKKCWTKIIFFNKNKTKK